MTVFLLVANFTNVVETSVRISLAQDYSHPDDYTMYLDMYNVTVTPALVQTLYIDKIIDKYPWLLLLTVDVLPYKIGLAFMGLVTLCVVVFEIIMCAKRKEVLERVKENCCKKEDHTDDKG